MDFLTFNNMFGVEWGLIGLAALLYAYHIYERLPFDKRKTICWVLALAGIISAAYGARAVKFADAQDLSARIQGLIVEAEQTGVPGPSAFSVFIGYSYAYAFWLGVIAFVGGAVVAMLKELRTFLSQVMEEMRKVVWPTKEETQSFTLVVLVAVAVVAVWVGGLDLIFSRFVAWLRLYE
jgi:preprotein translocase SecE subunit